MRTRDTDNIVRLYETTEKRYIVWLGNIDLNITEKIYVGAHDPQEALKYAIKKLEDREIKWTHHIVKQIEWPKSGYLKAIED